MKSRPEIDGLRAIAVLAVLLFHAGLGFTGGYVGVDVFFVISGYLITSLILKDLDAGQFRILNFWERRMRRILPAIVVVAFTCLVAGWFLFLPYDFKELGQSAMAQALLLSNVFFWQQSGYFAQLVEIKPLLHTWSLAVEEQFYLLFPFLLIALVRFARKSLVLAILVLWVVSFGLCVYGSYTHPSAAFYFLPTRAWELLAGSFLAALPAHRASPLWLRETLGWGGLAAILWGVFFYGRGTVFPGFAALLPCIGAALIIWTNGHALMSVGRLLAIRPLVFIGLISYSLYLWHWPILAFSKYWTLGEIPPWHRGMLLLASMLLAVLSWKFVETPIRKRAVLKNRRQIFVFAGSVTAALAMAGLAINQMQGMPSRIPPEVNRYANVGHDEAYPRDVSLGEVQNGNLLELGAGARDRPIELLVWGDSHAKSVMPVMDFLCKEHSIRGAEVASSATPPLVGYVSHAPFGLRDGSIPFNDAIVEFIHKKHVRNVFLVANWDAYMDYDYGTDRLRRGLIATINALQGSGTRIWILKQIPTQRWDVPRALAHAVFIGRDPDEVGLPLAEHREASRRMDPIFSEVASPDVVILDPAGLFVNRAGLCRAAEGGKALYRDSNHLTVLGAMLLRPLFEPIIERIGTSQSSGEIGHTATPGVIHNSAPPLSFNHS
jgi:peptidoglycan/LPS O-acetylase OafA/YrhL